MKPIDALRAPAVIPDPSSPEYQAAREVLADHPVTAGMDPMAMSSLAQHLVETMERFWLTGEALDEERKQQVDDAYSGFRDLLDRRGKRPQYVDAAIPDWARERYVEEQRPSAVPTAEPGSPLPLADVA